MWVFTLLVGRRWRGGYGPCSGRVVPRSSPPARGRFVLRHDLVQATRVVSACARGLSGVRVDRDVWASRRPRSRGDRPHVGTDDGPLRVFTLPHDARAVLLDLGKPGSVDIGPWRDRVRLVNTSYDGAWELPVAGAVPAPAAVLI